MTASWDIRFRSQNLVNAAGSNNPRGIATSDVAGILPCFSFTVD
jgi:hypothetical protein